MDPSDPTFKLEGLPVPDFNLQESSMQLIISVHVPLCKPDNISVLIEDNVVIFEAHPYHLNLKLPCNISNENHEESFNWENGTYVLTLRKESNGDEESKNGGEKNVITGNVSCGNIENQTDCGKKQLYGFANTFSGIFGPYYKEFSQVINLEDPDNTKEEERPHLKKKEEKKQWSEDHYLADFMENENIEPLLHYKPQWCSLQKRNLNQDELGILKGIPKMKCLETELSDNQRKLAEFQMVDILLSYCYNKRTTEGENTVGSAWTISTLSSCLSWFEVFTNLKSVLVSFYTRSLTYPLYRNWELTRVIHQDVVNLLTLGSSSEVTRCFIEMRELFDETENFHILNTLFIDPFCHFSRGLSEGNLFELADKIEKIEIRKEEVHEDLLILELAGKATLEEENLSRENGKQMNEITKNMSKMNFDDSESTSSSDSEDDVSSSDSSTEHISSGSTSERPGEESVKL